MRAKSGDYKIDLGNADLGKRITGATLETSLDSVSVLSVSLAIPYSKFKELKDGSLPLEGKVTWQGRPLFSGKLLSSDSSGFNTLKLVFADQLVAIKKMVENNYLKNQTLKDYLEKNMNESGMRCDFHGTFSEAVPSVDSDLASNFEDVVELSQKHGFFFVTRSSSQTIHFVKAGSHIKSVNVNARKCALELSQHESVEPLYSELQLKHFGANTSETKEKTLGAAELYGELSGFGSHAKHRSRTDRIFARGKIQRQESEPSLYESQDTFLKNRLAKNAMLSESIRMVVCEPIALPGDKISIEEPPSNSLQGGDFMVLSCFIQFLSATPKMEIIAVRA